MNSLARSEDKLNLSSGVTLIELLLVIAIMAIIGATITPMGSNFLARNYLANKTNEVASSLETAKLNTLVGKADKQWGVETSSSTIKLYAVGDSAFDQIYDVPSSISITPTNIVFSKLTGNPDSPVTIIISNNLSEANQVSVNQIGTINVQ